MLLIPRFYYIVNDNHSYHIDKSRKNKKRFIYDESLKAQRFYVYYNDFYDGKFIKFGEKFYYRPNWDFSKDWVYNNFCLNYDIQEDGHVMFKRPTNNLNKLYPYHQDLYYVFYSFESFEYWLHKDRIKLIWKVFPYRIYDIDAYRDMFILYIREHFMENEGNIFLLKIKFKSDQRTL